MEVLNSLIRLISGRHRQVKVNRAAALNHPIKIWKNLLESLVAIRGSIAITPYCTKT